MNSYDTERVEYGDSHVRLSRPSLVVATVSLAAGLVFGGTIYLNRSPEPAAHVDGTSAWLPHIVLFALAVAFARFVIRRRGADAAVLLLLAPLGSTAAHRLAHTARSILRHPTALLRLLLGTVPIVLLVYSPFRMGLQVLGGLDPNFTVNAWGGPGYTGAMACHYLDAVLLMGVAAYLLHLLLLPAER